MRLLAIILIVLQFLHANLNLQIHGMNKKTVRPHDNQRNLLDQFESFSYKFKLFLPYTSKIYSDFSPKNKDCSFTNKISFIHSMFNRLTVKLWHMNNLNNHLSNLLQSNKSNKAPYNISIMIKIIKSMNRVQEQNFFETYCFPCLLNE